MKKFILFIPFILFFFSCDRKAHSVVGPLEIKGFANSVTFGKVKLYHANNGNYFIHLYPADRAILHKFTSENTGKQIDVFLASMHLGSLLVVKPVSGGNFAVPIAGDYYEKRDVEEVLR